MSTPRKQPGPQSELPGKGDGSEHKLHPVLHKTAIIIVVILCLTTCALMLMLDPLSLSVDSVYQKF
jgi:hypothetical protein